MNKLATTQENNIVPSQDPNNLIALAVEQGADPEQLGKLLDLQERWQAGEAKKSYFNALSQFQSIVPALKRTKQGHNYKYTPLPDIAEQIRKPLLDCGLTYRFEMDHSEFIKVACIVTHVDGHSERTEMSAGADTSGSKNDVQAVGSTVSYLQRYTLIGALGITTADEDMDGRLSKGETIDNEQLANLESLIGEVNANRPQFLKYLKVKELEELPVSRYAQAVSALEKKRK